MLDEIKERRSIRKYLCRNIENEKLEEILESARLAPSGSNTQPWHFIVIRSNEMREKVAKVSHNQKWMLSAPVFIVCVADLNVRIKDTSLEIDENSPQEEVKQIIRDTALSMENMVIQANNLGLGACYVAWFTQNEIRPVLNIPNDKYVVGILTLGYADESPKQRPRKNLNEIIHNEHW